MGPILGALIAAGISGLFSTGATIAANKYNSPKSQLRRLRKAGLPLAFMYQGRVNTQSDVPKLSIDPTLGTTQQRNLEQSSPVQAGQAAKLAEEVKDLMLNNQWKSLFPDQTTGDVNNRYQILNAERDIQKTNAFIKQHEQTIKGIFADVEKNLFAEGVQEATRKEELKKISQQISNFLSQQGLMGQLQNIRSFEEQLNKTLGENLESMDDFTQSVWTLLWTLISKAR